MLIRIRDAVLDLVDSWVIMSTPLPPIASARVLICRLDRLGDYIIWLDSIRSMGATLKQQGLMVTLLANKEWAPLAMAEGVFDEVWPVDVHKLRNDIRYRIGRLATIRKARFSAIYSPRISKERGLEDAIVRVSAALRRVGVTGITENLSQSASKRAETLYTQLIRIDPAIRSERERNALVVQATVDPDYRPRLPRMRINAQRLDFELPETFCVLVPGGGAPSRRWPLNRFVEVARHVWGKYCIACVVVGSPNESELGREIAAQLGDIPIYNLTGRISLEQLTMVLSKARLAISNETGPAHLALACGCDTICITGGGHYGRFIPDPLASDESSRPRLHVVSHQLPCFGCNWNCPFASIPQEVPPCVTGVSIDDVLHAVDEAFKSRTHIALN